MIQRAMNKRYKTMFNIPSKSVNLSLKVVLQTFESMISFVKKNEDKKKRAQESPNSKEHKAREKQCCVGNQSWDLIDTECFSSSWKTVKRGEELNNLFKMGKTNIKTVLITHSKVEMEKG